MSQHVIGQLAAESYLPKSRQLMAQGVGTEDAQKVLKRSDPEDRLQPFTLETSRGAGLAESSSEKLSKENL